MARSIRSSTRTRDEWSEERFTTLVGFIYVRGSVCWVEYWDARGKAVHHTTEMIRIYAALGTGTERELASGIALLGPVMALGKGLNVARDPPFSTTVPRYPDEPQLRSNHGCIELA